MRKGAPPHQLTHPACVQGRDWLLAAHPPAAPLLRVLTYNVLAQVYTRSSWQTWSEPSCLRWKARGAALLAQLDALQPDVLMLQEVDEWPAFWERALAERGYAGLWQRRTGRKKDGVALAWRESAFELVASEGVEHNDLAAGLPVTEASARARAGGGAADAGLVDLTDPRARLERDSVALFAALRLRGAAGGDGAPSPAPQPQRAGLVVVATTHLFWDPACADVKLAQARHTLARLAAFSRSLAAAAAGADAAAAAAPAGAPPVLLGGDFNSLPGSEVHAALVARGGAPCGGALASAHASLAPGGDEPALTTHTPGFTGTLDYLLLGPGLAPAAVLGLPPLASLGAGLPGGGHPSDHLPLVADVGFA